MGVKDKEDQVGVDEMLILNLVHQVALVGVKVAVEDKGGIDRRYKCRSQMNIVADLKSLGDSRKADSAGHPGEVEAKYTI